MQDEPGRRGGLRRRRADGLVRGGATGETTAEGGVVDVPSQDSPPGPMGGSRRLTRRQVLGGLGAAVLAGVGLAVVGIDRLLRPTPVPASPAPTSLAASAGPSQGASPSPAASGVPAGPRRAFRSRPDLTPPLITVTPGSAPDASEGLIFLTPGNGAGVDGPLIVD